MSMMDDGINANTYLHNHPLGLSILIDHVQSLDLNQGKCEM